MFLNLILEQIENKARGKRIPQPLHRDGLPEPPAQHYPRLAQHFLQLSAEACWMAARLLFVTDALECRA
jgi:hypothetical protein